MTLGRFFLFRRMGQRQAQPHGQLRGRQLQDAGQHQRVGLWSDDELTYDVYLNEDRSGIRSPGQRLRGDDARMDGCRNGAGNAGLNVGKQEWTTERLRWAAGGWGSLAATSSGEKRWLDPGWRPRTWATAAEKTNVALLATPASCKACAGTKVGTTGSANRAG